MNTQLFAVSPALTKSLWIWDRLMTSHRNSIIQAWLYSTKLFTAISLQETVITTFSLFSPFINRSSALPTSSSFPAFSTARGFMSPFANRSVARLAHRAKQGRSLGVVGMLIPPGQGTFCPLSEYTIVGSVFTSSLAGVPRSNRIQIRCPPLGENAFWASWIEPFSEMLKKMLIVVISRGEFTRTNQVRILSSRSCQLSASQQPLHPMHSFRQRQISQLT